MSYEKNFQFWLNQVKECSKELYYVPSEFKTKAFYQEVIKFLPNALSEVPKAYIDEAMCLDAVKTKSDAFIYVPLKLRTEEVCSAAVENDNRVIRYMPLDAKAVFKNYDRLCWWIEMLANVNELEDVCRRHIDFELQKIWRCDFPVGRLPDHKHIAISVLIDHCERLHVHCTGFKNVFIEHSQQTRKKPKKRHQVSKQSMLSL